jgi:hypothetical protein
MQFPSSLRKSAAFLPLFAVALAATAWADTAGDLAFTAFPNADPNALAGGQVLQARGGLISFQRGITAQSLYVIDAPVAAVQAKLISWNPATHGELKVWLHKSLPARPAAGDFSGLASLPDNSSVNFLANATEKLDANDPALQVTKSEAQLIASLRNSNPDAKSLFVNAWSQIMAGRIAHFLSGNFSADTYAVSGGDINSLSEIKSLLRSDARIYARYHPLFAQTPLYNTNKATPVDLYYESFDVEGGAVLGTGAVYQSQTNGGSAAPAALPPGASILSADIEYFLNNGIYVSVELEQLSPVTINGKAETLVWRADQVSTSNVAYLHGTERLASGMIMLQDVKQAIDAFRSEFK